MELNVYKCEVMHFGQKNGKVTYYLNGERLQNALMQRDLGYPIHESQKISMQVQQTIKKANGMLPFIAKGIE